MTNREIKSKRVERQVKLPTSKAVEIAWKSIRMRLHRSLVVTSGIVLAVAFLMYVLSSDKAVEGMRDWMREAPGTTEIQQAAKRSEALQPKVQALAGEIVVAAAKIPEAASDQFDEKKAFGQELVQIQKELGPLPVAPDVMKKLLFARAEMVGTFIQWRDATRDLREAKGILNGPQNLVAMMKGNGVPTTDAEIRNARIQTNWLIVLALLVAFAGILNAMLMSVTERFREIGTMKCLGALDSFIVKLFLIESFFQGSAGTLMGILLGLLLSMLGMTGQYGSYAWKMYPYGNVVASAGACLGIGILLTVGGAVYPAWRAARMHPIEAMRVET
jgi:hypothetical protein